MSDWTVKIEYKNKELETVVEKEYDFADYIEMLRIGMMRIIMEVEDAFYTFSGNKQKEEWSPEMMEKFKKIRHKILDQANSIKRLPDTLHYKNHCANEMSASEFITKML